MQAAEQGAGVSLADLLGAYSLATDLGLGQPMEHLLRAWRIADLLAEHVGRSDEERAELFYVAVLSWVGCVADTPEVATWFGDDIAFRGDSFEIDFAGLPAMAFMLRHAGVGRPALDRVGLAAALVATRGRGIQRGLLSHCVSASTLASRLGLSGTVSDAVRQFFARWDGSGVPEDVAGAEVQGTIPMWQWIGDDGATTFSY